MERLYTNLGGIIRIAAICKKPDQAAFAELLGDLQGDIEAITAIKNSNRKDRDWFNHLSFVAEGSPAVAWITVVLLLSGTVPPLSVAHSDAAGKQARTIRDGDKGRNSILWESCHQRIQGKVGRHGPPPISALTLPGQG